MIDASTLAADMEQVYTVRPPYVSPGTTSWRMILSGAGCDCSGVPCAIYANHGMSLYHGSNTIARKHLTSREKLTSSAQLAVGMAVFKWSASGGEPEKYKADGLGDFHHIGIVTSVSPLRIVHQSSAAGQTACDATIKKWQYAGRLKGVNYNADIVPAQEQNQQEEIHGMYTIKINTDKLRIRAEGNTASAVLGSLRRGEMVSADELTGGWYKLSGRDGWVCGEYCLLIAETDPDGDQDHDIDDEVPADLAEILDRLDAIEARLAALEEG